jgi:hypothetical protein
MTGEPVALNQELAFHGEHKSELLKHHNGRFVLIKGRQVVGSFAKFQEAFEEGVRRLGHVPMLIKKVLAEEPVERLPGLTHGLTLAHP